MKRTVLRNGAVLLLTGVLLAPATLADAQSTPLCFGLSLDTARGQGFNVITVAGGRADGTDGRDFIIGSAGADQIDGRGGDDMICGKGGDDYMTGGAGSDRIKGGGGNDYIAGDNILTGQNVIGERTSGTVVSGPGGAGNDILAGGAGDDALFSNGGDDVLRGRDGDDDLDINSNPPDPPRNSGTGTGRDSLDGGAGNDRCSTDPADAPPVACESGPVQ